MSDSFPESKALNNILQSILLHLILNVRRFTTFKGYSVVNIKLNILLAKYEVCLYLSLR